MEFGFYRVRLHLQLMSQNLTSQSLDQVRAAIGLEDS